MLLEKELKKIFHQLAHQETAKIALGGSDITVRVFDHSSKISLVSPVYNGGNFIPKSVRQCLIKNPPFQEVSIKTNLSIDESKFQINLHYFGNVNHMNQQNFVDLLEEFSWMAEEWRLYLDENDKNDLIHIHAKQ